ncbi:MAG: hypothetical protein ACI8Y7_001170 [Candidatus Woesearchaeota archaeon]|jgi:hypothetical protein
MFLHKHGVLYALEILNEAIQKCEEDGTLNIPFKKKPYETLVELQDHLENIHTHLESDDSLWKVLFNDVTFKSCFDDATKHKRQLTTMFSTLDYQNTKMVEILGKGSTNKDTKQLLVQIKELLISIQTFSLETAKEFEKLDIEAQEELAMFSKNQQGIHTFAANIRSWL